MKQQHLFLLGITAVGVCAVLLYYHHRRMKCKGTQTKNSNRPSSGSRRRKRPSNKSVDKTSKHFKDQSSDDYDSSENDSLYSEDSVDAFKPVNNQNGDAHDESDLTYDSNDGLDFAGRSDRANMPTGSKHKRRRHLSPGPSHQQPDYTEIIDGPDGRRTIGIQTHVPCQRNRSSSSTRTDYSDYDGSFTSEGRGMVMSPLSLWNSNERSDRESHSDCHSISSAGYVKNLNDCERDMTPRLSTNASLSSERSNLTQGLTEVWSSSSSELRPLASFRDDLSYTFETEAMHPGTLPLDYADDSKSHHSSVYIRSPREGGRLIPRPDCSTPTNSGRVVNISFPESQLQQAANLDTETPVKFEVTVHENTTNIEYNVEKTEYKTYTLRNQNEPNIIPDRILINMTENVNSQTEENQTIQHREEITMHQPDNIQPQEDSLVLGKSYRTSTSSEKETEIEDGAVKREESKEIKKETTENSYYRLPSKVVASKKKMKLQNSEIENTNYPSTSLGEDIVSAPEYSKEGTSLNESDYTSDYGTITSVDGRYGYLTSTSDSEGSDSAPVSPRPSETKSASYSQGKPQHLSLQNEVTETDPSAMIIPDMSQNLCTSSVQSPTLNIAGTQVVQCGSAENQPEDGDAIDNKLDNSDFLHEDGPVTDLGYESMRPESSDEHKEDQNEDYTMETDSGSMETVRPARACENDNLTSQETLANLTGSNENVEKDNSERSERLDAEVPKLNLSQSSVSSPQRQHRLSISSADEPFLSLEQSESNTSTCSSDYKTPMQSPRENVGIELNSEIVPAEVDDVIIPDYYDEKQSTPRQSPHDFSLDQAPILTSSPKQSNDVRTASVNTESVPTALQSTSPAISTIRLLADSKDPVHTEALRKNIEQKIAKLTRHVRSLSDSAISSDFTDGDSSSMSPRGSRVYDDKSFLGEKKLLQALRLTQSPIRVRGTLNFEGSHPTKVPFKDSGNVFDDDSPAQVERPKNHRAFDTSPSREHFLPLATPVGTFPERLIHSLLAIRPQHLHRSHSLDSLSSIINLKPHLARAVRQVQSIENIPGAISPSDNTVSDSNWKGNNALMSTDGARSLSPGEIDIDQDMLDDINDIENMIQVDASQNRKICEKSTSMSILEDNAPQREYHRSLSEGNIDDFEDEMDNSNTSNDSITFVFIKDDRAKPGDSEKGKSEQTENTSVSDPFGSRELCDSENELFDSIQLSNHGEHSNELANISGRGPIDSKSEDRISDVLSISGSEDSVIEYNQSMGDAEEDRISTHSASEEIEEIIDSVENQEQMHGRREMDIVFQNDSPPTYTDTSESFVQSRGKYYEEDSEPLRHKFGIDESVLPIPERSMSADNIPKHLKPQNDLMRSRSTGMLDVGVIDEPESESGIFPPALRTDTDQTEPSISLHTMSEGGLDHTSQRTFSDIDASLSNRTSGDVDSENCNSGENSSAIVRSICSKSSSVSSLEEEFIIDYKTNWGKHKHKHGQETNHSGDSEDDDRVIDEEQQIRRVLETVQRLICPKPRSVDRGMTTENEKDLNSVSIGVQTNNSETSPEATSNLPTLVNADQIILPALAAPFRAQSMDSFGLGATGQGLELSEESRNWCTLGELMVETTHLLRRINDRLPEQTRKGSISSSEDSQVSQVILKKWQEISIQTGRSLEDLTTVGSQTDGDYMLVEKEGKTNRTDSTRDKQSLKHLDMADTITHDILQVPSESCLCEMSVQTDESFDEFSVIETRVSTDLTDAIHNANMPSQHDIDTSFDEIFTNETNSNTEQICAQAALVSFSPKEQQQNNESFEKKDAKQLHKAKYIPQLKAELGLDQVKSDEESPVMKTESPRRQEVVKSPNKMLPGFTLPDTPEIVELRKEHAKLMENLRKASDERRNRKEKLQARKMPLDADEISKQISSSEAKDKNKADSRNSSQIKSDSKIFKFNKNDPETETSSSNSSMVENNVISDDEDRENKYEENEVKDVVRSDGEDKVTSKEFIEDIVRSDGDDQECVDNVRSDIDDKESLENVRSDDEDAKQISEIDASLESLSPMSTQEFVQINIQVDPSSGVTVKNKTVREPSPKRKALTHETDKKGNIKEEHKWEIAGDEFRTVWERRTESRSRSESNASEDTVGNTFIIEEFPADPAVVEAMKLDELYPMNKSDENLSREIIEDVLENNPTSSKKDMTSDMIPGTKELNKEVSDSDGRDSPASIIEDIVQPESCKREQHVPNFIEQMTQNKKNDGNLETQHTASQEPSLLEETIIPQVYKRDHSLPPSFRSRFGESSPKLVQESEPEEDSRKHGKKVPQQIFKSETSPKYRAQILRDQQRQGTSPDFMESTTILPESMFPHQHSTNTLPQETKGPKENEIPLVNNVNKAVSKPPRFADDSTQMSLAFSDDCTQTDPDILPENTQSLDYVDQISPKYENATHTQTRVKGQKPGNVKAKTQEAKTSEEFREELESLQHERQHIMDLLGLSYLPNSLTVELLEAKLNYCIGQTDLLLDSLEDTTEAEHFTPKVLTDQRHTKDFISKYRADLKKSKNDIKECREQLNKGRGRGRPAVRGRPRFRRGDIINQQRQAEIDAFKLERLREQQDYSRASRHGTPLKGNTPLRGNTPLHGNSPVVTPRSEHSRSASPSYSPGYMNPREHKAHLVDLRRQLIKDVVEEEIRHSRSCSPSFHTSPPPLHFHTSPPPLHKQRNASEHSLGFSPKVSVSLSDIPGSPLSSPPSSGGSKTYIVAPGSTSLSPVRKQPSYESVNPYGSYQSSPDRAYQRRRTSPLSLDLETTAESIFSPQESEQILKEIEELKKRAQISAPIEEMLRRSSYSSSSSQRTLLRYMTLFSSTFRKRSSSSRPDVPGISPRSHSDPRLPRRTSPSPVSRQFDNPLSLNLDCLQDDETGPYSPYSAYAREHIIPNQRSPPGGLLRGTYELYHDRSDTSSVLSYDSDTFVDHGHTPRHNTLDEDTIKRLRPIRAEDIKARINRHKR
ncbi:LOW QUALITY PROTEIN: uncharacterized protein LOC132730778 [Ruditapes philippinarum]|uniref:LOW QUALITY PROTEIN: uncharacterized protein LOC132730778 n=1 Tax=Ruditapes philippinarum TaxID=129788 RepID=UPI00295B158C|nr:LOW QUALITY PROTEIN: uncharacterized protein LOC132730778 [Ruditapes philippinarum]